ncbi:hypothetical protein C8Q72DRAFT_498725 [Fomitopsis betulina]|nr:hypothetical protein C8Q72DRAFT_498725 [Fomitopsis betulina]
MTSVVLSKVPSPLLIFLVSPVSAALKRGWCFQPSEAILRWGTVTRSRVKWPPSIWPTVHVTVTRTYRSLEVRALDSQGLSWFRVQVKYIAKRPPPPCDGVFLSDQRAREGNLFTGIAFAGRATWLHFQSGGGLEWGGQLLAEASLLPIQI